MAVAVIDGTLKKAQVGCVYAVAHQIVSRWVERTAEAFQLHLEVDPLARLKRGGSDVEIAYRFQLRHFFCLRRQGSEPPLWQEGRIGERSRKAVRHERSWSNILFVSSTSVDG